MKNLARLLALFELTRHQTLQGYLLTGVTRHDLPSLAEHSFLVTLAAWRLAKKLQEKGAKINLERTIELALSHDLGELFGGDISMTYGRLNPKAKKLARDFEKENVKFLAEFAGKDKENFIALVDELFEIKSDEAVVAKIADYIECAHFMVSISHLSKNALETMKKKIAAVARMAKSKKVRQIISSEIKSWQEDIVKIQQSKETDKYLR